MGRPHAARNDRAVTRRSIPPCCPPPLPKSPAPPPADPSRLAARAAGLRYANDDVAGFTRRRRGKGFSYHDQSGATIRAPEVVARIRSIVIPPAWTDVWICPWPNGHLQATGRDARGRKQHRYHAQWRETRDSTKYDKMI